MNLKNLPLKRIEPQMGESCEVHPLWLVFHPSARLSVQLVMRPFCNLRLQVHFSGRWSPLGSQSGVVVVPPKWMMGGGGTRLLKINKKVYYDQKSLRFSGITLLLDFIVQKFIICDERLRRKSAFSVNCVDTEKFVFSSLLLTSFYLRAHPFTVFRLTWQCPL